MSRTTSEVPELTGSQCPGMASSQVAAIAARAAEQDGDPRCDERPEHQSQQDQGQRDRGFPALPKSASIWAYTARFRLRVTGLGYPQARMAALDRLATAPQVGRDRLLFVVRIGQGR